MDIIDKKLFDLGFTLQHFGDYSAGYLRGVDGEYAHKVEIKVGDDGKGVFIRSCMTGNNCEWGHSCSVSLNGPEMTLFWAKMLKLRVAWWLKRAFRQVVNHVKQ